MRAPIRKVPTITPQETQPQLASFSKYGTVWGSVNRNMNAPVAIPNSPITRPTIFTLYPSLLFALLGVFLNVR